MKKCLSCILCLLLSVSLFAQRDSVDIKSVTFYGVDFTECKIIGATESPEAFLEAFRGINNLLLLEPSKYDLSKYFDCQVIVSEANFEQVNNHNAESKPDMTFTNQEISRLTEAQLQEIISGYQFGAQEGYGLIIIATELNKTKSKGYFYGCYFDLSTGKLIYAHELDGKPKGFGLRNFWAGSLLAFMKHWKDSSK
ncbi:MAG: hypothetical protein RR346_02870 [Bacteroidales bacterium]